MDKSWITKPRNSPEYEQGVSGFIDFAFAHRSVNSKIICPCSLCAFKKWQTRDVVYEHLICKQFPKGYTFWFYHGESSMGETSNVSSTSVLHTVQDPVVQVDSIRNMINEAFGPLTTNREVIEGEGAMPNVTQEGHEAKEFYELLRDGEQPLYEGCARYSKLSFMVKLYHIKCLCRMSDKSMTMILELLNDAFEHAKIPGSFYEAKKTITKLGLNYNKIHACPNNCMLYWGEDENRETCKVCNKSRWKASSKGGQTGASIGGNKRKKLAAKILRYFPLKL